MKFFVGDVLVWQGVKRRQAASRQRFPPAPQLPQFYSTQLGSEPNTATVSAGDVILVVGHASPDPQDDARVMCLVNGKFCTTYLSSNRVKKI